MRIDFSPIFLLFLAVASNFLSKSLSASSQQFFKEKRSVYAIAYFVLLFSLYNGGSEPFATAVGQSLAPYLLFLALTVVGPKYLLASMGLFLTAYVSGREREAKRAPDRLRTLENLLNAAGAVVLAAGVAAALSQTT